MSLMVTAERRDRTSDHEVVDRGLSRALLLTTSGSVLAGSAVLAQAVAGVTASRDEERRATPRDLLEAVRMPLDELF